MNLPLRTFVMFAALSVVLGTGGPVLASKSAPDFPPGVFTDGKQHSLADLQGQVVVLFFYEKNCPSCTKKIPERNELVKQYQGKPVKFFAIAAGDTPAEAKAYAGRTGLAMPVFADKLSMMEERYGTKISLNNIYQFRVIGPDGTIVGYSMDAGTIDSALARIELAYDPADYHDELGPVVGLLNTGNERDALRGLRKHERDRDEAVKASALALKEAVTERARGWVSEADAIQDTDPFTAGRLYTKAATLFSTEDFGKDAKAKARGLRSNPLVKDETAAQKMYAKMNRAVDQIDATQVGEMAKYARKIAEKYPDTPTGKKAAALADDLDG